MMDNAYREKYQKALDCLQLAVEDDPVAMSTLLSMRIPCNACLANHPTIEVGTFKTMSGNRISVVGLLNGIFRSMELPEIETEWEWGPEDKAFVPELKAIREHIPQEDKND